MTLSPFAVILLVAAVCAAILGATAYVVVFIAVALLMELSIAESRRRQSLPPR